MDRVTQVDTRLETIQTTQLRQGVLDTALTLQRVMPVLSKVKDREWEQDRRTLFDVAMEKIENP